MTGRSALRGADMGRVPDDPIWFRPAMLLLLLLFWSAFVLPGIRERARLISRPDGAPIPGPLETAPWTRGPNPLWRLKT